MRSPYPFRPGRTSYQSLLVPRHHCPFGGRESHSFMNVRNTSRLKIALIPPLWARVAPSTMGGVEFIVHLLADELVKRGHDVTTFTSSDSTTGARVVPLTECNLTAATGRVRAWEHGCHEPGNIREPVQASG